MLTRQYQNGCAGSTIKGKHTCGKKHVAKVVEFTPFSLKKFLAEQIGTYAEIINSMQAIPGQWNLNDEIISLKLYSKGTLEFLNGTMPLLRGKTFQFSKRLLSVIFPSIRFARLYIVASCFRHFWKT